MAQLIGDVAGRSVRKVHFVGVGGISMSGLARIFLDAGYRVSGSDLVRSEAVDRLVASGLRFFPGHAASHVNGADLVVYTAAVRPDNPELAAARRRGIPLLGRAELIGRLMEDARYGIAVAGTHGKTTTTSMVGAVLEAAGLRPTILVGGEVDMFGGNVRIGSRDYFVTEACEYTGSFLRFRPHAGVILNIDDDHLDYFKTIDGVVEAFRRFAGTVSPGGVLVANAADARVRAVATPADTRARVVTFAAEGDADWTAGAVDYAPRSPFPRFTPTCRGRPLGELTLKVPGPHNVANALAAAAVADALGVPGEAILAGLSGFAGVHRRFERVGEYGGAPVYDDYAHHPAAVRATLQTARRFQPARLLCAFQPHLYSRTRQLLDRFAEALCLADVVVLADIYAARESDPGDISARDLAAAVAARGGRAVYAGGLDEVTRALTREARPQDLIMTMGAGDIYRVARDLARFPARDRAAAP